MRRALSVSVLVLCLGCATPRTSGSLWALDEAHLEEEMVYRTPDPQRAAQARQFEMQVADEVLAADQARLEALLKTCPEPRTDRLEVSPSARARDGVRARQEPDRSARVTRLAAADWYLRRAATSGDTGLCDRARAALTQTPERAGSFTVPDAQVERDGEPGAVLDAATDPYRALTDYGLGLVDAVRGSAPLVGDLATVYGGSVDIAADQTGSPEEIVDRLAPSLSWEPDGLYAALRAAR
jgi:protein-tyrosine-phosphatase